MTIEKLQLQEAATCLVEDLHMLMDGTWVPDADSCQASVDNAVLLADSLPLLLGAVETLEAIRARLNGVYDHPALVKFGPLSVTRDDDILAMINKALDEKDASVPAPPNGYTAEAAKAPATEGSHPVVAAAIAAMYRGEIDAEKAARDIAGQLSASDLAEYLVDAFSRTWISRFNLGIDEDGNVI